jgi:hypothetical protein
MNNPGEGDKIFGAILTLAFEGWFDGGPFGCILVPEAAVRTFKLEVCAVPSSYVVMATCGTFRLDGVLALSVL